LLEYSCLVFLDMYGSQYYIDIEFDIDGTPPSPYSKITLQVSDTGIDTYSPCTMRYYIESSTAGAHTVRILTYISQDYTNSWVKYSVLTVTVF